MRPSVVMVGAALALSACGQPGTGKAPAADPAAKAKLATLPAAYQNADLDNGEAQVAQCRACHVLTKGGGNAVGPNLYGVFGRKAGTAPGFSYSPGLKATGIMWDAPSIDHWIANPRAVVAGTKMSFAGLEKPTDRRDVVAYLRVKTSD